MHPHHPFYLSSLQKFLLKKNKNQLTEMTILELFNLTLKKKKKKTRNLIWRACKGILQTRVITFKSLTKGIVLNFLMLTPLLLL